MASAARTALALRSLIALIPCAPTGSTVGKRARTRARTAAKTQLRLFPKLLKQPLQALPIGHLQHSQLLEEPSRSWRISLQRPRLEWPEQRQAPHHDGFTSALRVKR